MKEEIQDSENRKKHLTNEEIGEIVGMVKNPGLRFTVDLYLLDYIKHCFLEDQHLRTNIQKLQYALDRLEDAEAKKGVEDVMKSLQCVQTEYEEYVEDVRVLAQGAFPRPRGAGQSNDESQVA